MNKKAERIQVLVFLLFIGTFFIINLLKPDKKFSQQENRELQTRPKFSLSALFSGSYTKDFETYVTDQFAFRDSWTSLKAKAELLSGKQSNNGVFLCEGETLLECFTRPSEEDLNFNLDAVRGLSENTDADVYFALIPSGSEIWRDLLPAGAENDSQKELIDYSYSYCGLKNVDMYSALNSHRDEAIFYRTDHHWTTLGAYYGYTAVMDAMGMTPLPLSAYSPKTVTDSFLGTTYSSSGFSWVKPESIITYVEQGNTKITNYPEGTAETGSLYVESFLEVKDKYSFFYGGNTPLLEIQTENDEAPSLLIIRDSYMDSLSPFLFKHFSKISIVDLRYYKTSLKAYMANNSFDNVLVCYSVPNFSVDRNVFLAAY